MLLPGVGPVCGALRGAAPAGQREEAAVSQNPGQDDRETGIDDFTRISGIGSKIAQRLVAAGIRTYADLASRSAADIAELLPDVTGLSAGRVDAWRDQASELAAAPAAEVPVSALQNGQHYESFLVRVLLNEDGSIRRTTARHVRTGEERHWPGLERDELPAFIMAALSRPPETAQTAEAAGETPAETPAGPPSGQERQAAAAPVPAPRPGEPRPAAVPGEPARAPRTVPRSSTVLSLERAALRAAEPFTLTMRVQLEPTVKADQLVYSAVIVARPMGGGPKRTIAQTSGLFTSTAPTISIDASGLPAGVYKLDGAVSLHEPGGEAADLAGLAEGLLVQVLPG